MERKPKAWRIYCTMMDWDPDERWEALSDQQRQYWTDRQKEADKEQRELQELKGN